MMDVVYEFFGITGLDAYPASMAELIPYLLKFFVAVALVLGIFKAISYISGFFFNWRWFK